MEEDQCSHEQPWDESHMWRVYAGDAGACVHKGCGKRKLQGIWGCIGGYSSPVEGLRGRSGEA